MKSWIGKLALALWLPTLMAAPAPLKVGIVPQQAAVTLAEGWIPLLQRLSKDSGLPMQFETAPDIPTFEQRLALGNYDLAYMNPYHYTVFHERPGYLAIAREKDTKLVGILVTAVNSNITDIKQLAGKKLAFPAPAAFAATILPRAELAQAQITTEAHYVGSHDSVYLAVSQGLYPAGGGITRTFEQLAPETRSKLRILWQTAPYTPHAFAVHPHLPADQRAKLQAALVQLGQSAAGKALLDKVGLKELGRATDSDWNDIRALQKNSQLRLPSQ